MELSAGFCDERIVFEEVKTGFDWVAKVLSVADESAADKAGIKEGDIITKFDNTEVNSATTLANAARESRSKQSVHVVVTRGGKIMDIEVKTPRKLKTADL